MNATVKVVNTSIMLKYSEEVMLLKNSKLIKRGSYATIYMHVFFFQVSDIFLPKTSVSLAPILYGYVTHKREEKLHKLDLHKLSVVSVTDLSQYDCHPVDLAFFTNGTTTTLYHIIHIIFHIGIWYNS